MRSLPSQASRPVAALAIVALCAAGPALADVVPQTFNGVPLLPIPTFEEVGLPPFTMPTGTLSPPDTQVPPDTTTASGTGDSADSTAMTTMMSRSWGEAASQYAEAVGVTPVSVAATCTMESACSTNPATNGTISGTFQMRDDTFTAMINAAIASDPNLATNIVPGLAGKLDPATQSIAAAEYLRQGAQYLQMHDVPNPSVLDVRGYYNFGPGNAVSLAQAPDTALMSAEITGLSTSQFRLNGINPASTTVGQWRASIAGKIGPSAAASPVLLNPS